ncbi:hypothetical protein Hanom_Chr17g01544321 [Helianthus anomalus]
MICYWTNLFCLSCPLLSPREINWYASNTGPKNTNSICISDFAFKYAAIVPDLFVLKRCICISVCIFKRSVCSKEICLHLRFRSLV